MFCVSKQLNQCVNEETGRKKSSVQVRGSWDRVESPMEVGTSWGAVQDWYEWSNFSSLNLNNYSLANTSLVIGSLIIGR